MVRFRQAERSQNLEVLRELIEEARKRAKSHYTSSKERARWVKLAGQLLWYKDQVLRSMNLEALQKEVAELKQIVINKDKPPPLPNPPWARQLDNQEKTQATE